MREKPKYSRQIRYSDSGCPLGHHEDSEGIMKSITWLRFGLFLALTFTSTLAYAAEWPLTSAQLEEILGRSKMSKEDSEAVTAQLVENLHIKASLAARKEFFAHLEKNYDAKAPEKDRQRVVENAKAGAYRAAAAEIEKWVTKKGKSGKSLLTPRTLSVNLDVSLPNKVQIKFDGDDRFLDDGGKINLRSAELTAMRSAPEAERPEADLLHFAASRFEGSPAERVAIAKANEPKAVEITESESRAYSEKMRLAEEDRKYWKRTYCGSGGHTCGLKQGEAPAHHPEMMNGSR